MPVVENGMKFQKRLLRAEPNFQILTKLWQVNWLYVILICALAVVGYVALYSAGGGTSRPFAGPQSIRFCFGVVMMLGIALMSPAILGMHGMAALYFLAHPAGGGTAHGACGQGAERWLMLGGMQVQPSELAKIALVLMLAAWFHKISYRSMGNPLLLVPPALMVLAPVALVLKEPNLEYRRHHRHGGGEHVLWRGHAAVADRAAHPAGAHAGQGRLQPPA
ncbi:FtsW/RodA/SpoVE family cell cycle protein [Komagataeibacter rhaeticus]|nr:FtsW/RodA/SpoVE family cell cycle protein [Komagataeibacter rhaeticus]